MGRTRARRREPEPPRSTYTTPPLVFYFGDSESAVTVMEIVRSYADPRLTVIIEGDSEHQVWQRICDINAELAGYTEFRIPLPERCPTCGKETTSAHSCG